MFYVSLYEGLSREDLEKKTFELEQENQQLKERVAYLERSNNRREDTIISLRQEQQLDLYKSVIDEVRDNLDIALFGIDLDLIDNDEFLYVRIGFFKELLRLLNKIKEK